MKATRLLNLVMATMVVVVLAPPVCAADMPTEPRGGKPPAGSKPSPETVLMLATVSSLNVSDRIATLTGEDGATRTIKVGEDVPLDLVNVGDKVRVRITHAIAISVEHPKTN